MLRILYINFQYIEEIELKSLRSYIDKHKPYYLFR